jgi:hypothetical protein
MMFDTKTFRILIPLCGLLLSAIVSPTAWAVPSFARQTGMSCAACHTAFPQLTAFGRQFKLQGYTMTAEQELKGDGLDIDLWAPLSLMLQTTWSHQSKAPDENSDNTKVSFPSELSLFYAGRVTDKIGAFVQITSADGGSLSQDNTDIRFADSGKLGETPVLYGITLNNNPTVQDPWNSTPAWGFPWFEAGFGYQYPHPLLGAIGGSVAGLTGYGFWDNHIYAELGAYEAANSLGKDGPGNDGAKAIKGVAPYWRLAYTADAGKLNWEVGTFGMKAEVPTNGFDNARDKFTDFGLDTQLQWTLDNDNSLTLDGNFIHEDQSLDATSPADTSQHLDTMKLDLTWYSHHTWGATLGYHGAASSSNAVAFSDDIGGDGILSATAAGGQDAQAWLFQLDYTPWINTRFALQYTDYVKLNGTTSGASDSNQLMVGAWFMF